MWLELRQTAGPGLAPAARRWVLEHGRRILGDGSDCDWAIDGDGRDLSDLRCLISRDRDGFVLVDQSAHGTRVDAALLRQGETARLRQGSVIALGPLAFEVTISGEAGPDLDDPDPDLALSDEMPMISSILGDVAPGHQRASGLLGRLADGGEPGLGLRPPRDAPGRDGLDTPSSRHVRIGWDGPPRTEGPRTILPDDWDKDFGEGSLATRLEHRAALSTAVPRKPGRHGPRADTADPLPDEALDALAGHDPLPAAAAVPAPPSPTGSEPLPAEMASPDEAGPDAIDATELGISAILGMPRAPHQADAGVTAAAGGMPVEAAAFRPAEAEPRLEALLRDGEEAVAEICDLLGLAADGATPRGAAGGAIAERLSALTARQIGLRDAMVRLVREAGRCLEPRAIEARVDAAAGSAFWRRRAYWQAYREQFRRDGRDISVQAFLQGLLEKDGRP